MIEARVVHTSRGTHYVGPDSRKYRRIVGGVGWPAGGQPGFLVVLGEGLDEEWGLGARHLRVLDEAMEHAGESFVDPEHLLRGAVALGQAAKVSGWYSLQSVHEQGLAGLNQELREKKQPRLQILRPPMVWQQDYLHLLAAAARRRIVGIKTLHFGASVVPRHMDQLPEDLAGVEMGRDPVVAAFFCALAALDLDPVRRAGGGGYAAADGEAGY